VEPEAAVDARGRAADRRGDEEKANAPMDRENAAMVLETDNRFDVATVQQKPPQRGAAAVRGKPAGQHETGAPAVATECDRPFAEELITVGVSIRLRGIDAGIAGEAKDACRVWCGAIVGANHVPWRVAENGVEAAIGQACPIGAEEHLGTLELPVEKMMVAGHLFGGAQVPARRRRREGAGRTEHHVGQTPERLGRDCLRGKP
jgi:hypothetical protein